MVKRGPLPSPSPMPPRRGAAKALQAQRAAAAQGLQEGGLKEGGPAVPERLAVKVAAEAAEAPEEAGSGKGPLAAAAGGESGGASGTSRATSAQDVGGASGAAGSVQKEAAAQGQEEEEGWGGSGTIHDRRARRRALEQVPNVGWGEGVGEAEGNAGWAAVGCPCCCPKGPAGLAAPPSLSAFLQSAAALNSPAYVQPCSAHKPQPLHLPPARCVLQMGGDRPERAGLTLFLDKQDRE